jgi:hypothetical protein
VGDYKKDIYKSKENITDKLENEIQDIFGKIRGDCLKKSVFNFAIK